MGYLLHLVILFCIYIILCVSLNHLAGYGGVISLLHAGLFGLGAYLSALCALKLNFPFVFSFLTAAFITGFFGAILGIVLLRLKQEALALATLGFSIILFDIFNNWESLTEGPMGLTKIPTPTDNLWIFLILSLSLALISILFFAKVGSSPYGRLLKAVRDDEELAASLGKKTIKVRVSAFFISSFFAGVAGSIFAHYITYVDPTSFKVMESVAILSMVIVGGTESELGSVVGAFVFVFLPEFLRFVGFPSDIAANVRQIIFGIALVVLMIYRPQGIFGKFRIQ